jgi:alpha-ribazole phosphatase
LARLFLVRHGETDSNSAFRYWGKTDVGLGPLGLKQAELLRERLAAEKIDHVYSSDLKRTLTTTQTIVSGRDLKLTACPELREIDFGEVEGLNFDEVKEKFPAVALMWVERDPRLAYPGGESLAQLEQRISRFIDRLTGHAANDNILVVAHSGVLRTLICQLMDMELKHRWNFRVDLASLSVIHTYSGFAVLSLLNDVSHLKENCK